MYRTVFVYPDFDPRCHAHLHRCLGHVGISSLLGRRGASSAILGFRAGRKPRAGSPAEELDWSSVSTRGWFDLSWGHSPDLFRHRMAAVASLQRIADHTAYRRALAHSSHVAQSALLRLHSSQRARAISRFSLVLLRQ